MHMKKISLKINDHSDRMALIEVLQDNGYEIDIRVDTASLDSHRTYVEFWVKDSEVIDLWE